MRADRSNIRAVQSLDVSNVLDQVGLGNDSGYWCGRAASFGDCDGEMLERICRGVTVGYGENAGKSAIELFMKLENLGASQIIDAVQNLSAQGWRVQSENLRHRSGIEMMTSHQQAFALLATPMFGSSQPDATENIRRQFRCAHEMMSRSIVPCNASNWNKLELWTPGAVSDKAVLVNGFPAVVIIDRTNQMEIQQTLAQRYGGKFRCDVWEPGVRRITVDVLTDMIKSFSPKDRSLVIPFDSTKAQYVAVVEAQRAGFSADLVREDMARRSFY